MSDDEHFADLLKVFGVSWTISSEVHRIDATTLGSKAKVYLPGLVSWTITYGGPISGIVSAGSKDEVMAATISELLTRMR